MKKERNAFAFRWGRTSRLWGGGESFAVGIGSDAAAGAGVKGAPSRLKQR